jgi:hypothetical protein
LPFSPGLLRKALRRQAIHPMGRAGRFVITAIADAGRVVARRACCPRAIAAAWARKTAEGQIMRTIACLLVTSAVVAAFVAPITAEARTNKHGYQAQRNSGYHDVEKYEEFLAEKRAIGSSSWWDQMDREGRGGRK